MKWILLTAIFTVFSITSFSQDLFSLFNDSSSVQFTQATFKSSRLVIGQSIESPSKYDVVFIIGHHFGKINSGVRNFFGLDVSTIRLGFLYGITDRLSIGIGRSMYQKNIDGFIKYKLLRQSAGKGRSPVSLSYLGVVNLITMPWSDSLTVDLFYPKASYVNQLLVARKFNSKLSLQYSFTHVHYNLVKRMIDQNNVFAAGIGGRMKISKRSSVNAEYHWLLPGQTANDYNNSLSFGVDMETGGHVFQLFLTNSQPLFERGFIVETKGQWSKGDIYFGFNIHRTFSLKAKRVKVKQ